MSHGPGTVQRLILEKVKSDRYVVLRDVKEFKQPAVNRAAKVLSRKNLIKLWYINLHTSCKLKYREGRSCRKVTVAVPLDMTDEEFKEIRERYNLWPYEKRASEPAMSDEEFKRLLASL